MLPTGNLSREIDFVGSFRVIPALVVSEEGIRHPDLFGEIARQCQDHVLLPRESQSIVPPVLIQAQS